MAKKEKLTKQVIDSLPHPDKGQTIHKNPELRGFAIRITPTKKSFIVNRKFNGKLTRYKFGEYPDITVEQARKEASKIITDLGIGILPQHKRQQKETQGITLNHAYQDMIKTKNYKPKTLSGYNDNMKNHLNIWHKTLLTDIKRNMILELHKEISKNSPSASNSTMRLLQTIINFAQAKYRINDDQPLIIENPVKILSDLKVWNKEKRRTRLISAQELPEWHKALFKLEDSPLNNYAVTRDYLLFILFTGLRRREASTMRWDQVNFKKKTFTIPDTKNHKDHTRPLSQYLLELLNQRRNQRKNNIPYIFPDKTNTSYIKEPKSFIKKISIVCEIEFSTHDLRRTFTTIAESLDIPYYSLKRLLNHSQINDVTAGYIIDDVERLRNSMEKISKKIKELISQ